MNDIKVSPKMKKKGWLNIAKINLKKYNNA